LEAIERITGAVLERAARGDALSPAAVTFLVHRYRAGSQPDVSDVLGSALAVALAPFDSQARPLAQAKQWADRSTFERAEWLRAFTEALTASDDERLLVAARDLVEELAAEWPTLTAIGDAAPSIDACLAASHLVDRHELVPRAIDELERIISAVYHPGHDIGEPSDHVRAASALLTAFEVTGRLPYSMLAEELVQTSRDRLLHADLVTCCSAARVFGRLAALHDDPAYRAAAVIKTGADYRADAHRILERVSACLADADADAAHYGLALDELE
jgi:hypothetical protein